MQLESGFQVASDWSKIREMTLTSRVVLELWRFSYIRDWPEIQKLEILLPEFCPISGDWGK